MPTNSEWSKEFPQESGVYWWRTAKSDSDPDIVEVDREQGFVYDIGEPIGDELSARGGEFLGPINPEDSTRTRQEHFDEAIAAATTAFDKQPGDSQSYHDNTMVNASAMERRVKHALTATRDSKEK